MPRVFIPPPLRAMTNGQDVVEVSGANVRAVIDELDLRFPGLRDRFLDGDRLKPGLSVGIGTRVSARGLLSKVEPEDEVHFLPAIGGG